MDHVSCIKMMMTRTINISTNKRHKPLSTARKYRTELEHFVLSISPDLSTEKDALVIVAVLCRVAVFLLSIERGAEGRQDLNVLRNEFKRHQSSFERNNYTPTEAQHFEYFVDDNTTQDYLGEVKKAIQKTFVEWEFEW